jgi:hypothetical protein
MARNPYDDMRDAFYDALEERDFMRDFERRQAEEFDAWWDSLTREEQQAYVDAQERRSNRSATLGAIVGGAIVGLVLLFIGVYVLTFLDVI